MALEVPTLAPSGPQDLADCRAQARGAVAELCPGWACRRGERCV